MTADHNTYCKPTVGQLERELAQKINALYQRQLGHRAKKVDCHIFANKVFIYSENVMTSIEKLLLEAPSPNLVHQIRGFLDSSIKEQVAKITQEITKIQIDSCIYNTSVETGSAVGIVMLADTPQVRRKKNSCNYKNHKNVIQMSHLPEEA